MNDRGVTVVSQENLDFIEIENSNLSFYKSLAVGIYPNNIFAEVSETFQFLKKCFPSISETILHLQSKERKQLMSNLNSVLKFNYVRHGTYRDVHRKTLVGAKFLNIEDCLYIFKPTDLL
jgi:hypothetical protein